MIESVNPFIASTYSVFGTMLQCELQRGDPHRNERFQPHHDVSGIIGLSGVVTGMMIVSFDKNVAMAATGALLGETVDSINDDVIDAVGELANMIAGGAKATLEAFNLRLALPAVVTGNELAIDSIPRVRPIRVPFESVWGSLSIEVGFVDSDELRVAQEDQRVINAHRPIKSELDLINEF